METADTEEAARNRHRKADSAVREAAVWNVAVAPRRSCTLVNMCLSLMPLCFCVPLQIYVLSTIRQSCDITFFDRKGKKTQGNGNRGARLRAESPKPLSANIFRKAHILLQPPGKQGLANGEKRSDVV